MRVKNIIPGYMLYKGYESGVLEMILNMNFMVVILTGMVIYIFLRILFIKLITGGKVFTKGFLLRALFSCGAFGSIPFLLERLF